MKKWLWVPILLISLSIFCRQKQGKVEQMGIETEKAAEEMPAIAQKVATNLDLAIENMAKGQTSDGIALLLDTVLLAKPHEQWPEGFVEHISAAKEHFASDNFSDGVGEVSAALNLIKKPAGTKQSKERGEIAPISALMKDKIEEAKEMFIKGDGNQGVISLLEALQLSGPKTN